MFLLQIYQLLLHYLGHTDHNVVTACLEALQQLLRTPPTELRTLLTTEGGIKETYIFTKDIKSPLTKGIHFSASARNLKAQTVFIK